MLSDEQLAQLSCETGWENCACVRCAARREIIWMRGEIDDLNGFVDSLRATIQQAARLFGFARQDR